MSLKGSYWYSYHEFARYIAPGLYLATIFITIIGGLKLENPINPTTIISVTIMGIIAGTLLNTVGLYKFFPWIRKIRKSFEELVTKHIEEYCEKDQRKEYPSCFYRAIDLFIICTNERQASYIKMRLDSALLKLTISAISLLSLVVLTLLTLKHLIIFNLSTISLILMLVLGMIFPHIDGIKDLKRNYYLVATIINNENTSSCIKELASNL